MRCKKSRHIPGIIALILGSGLIVSCGSLESDSELHGVSLGDFRDKLRQRLDGQVVGYSFSLQKNGTVINGSGGKAKRGADGNVDMSAATRIYTASVTKNLTAIGVLQLLRSHNLGISSKISPFLPGDWAQGPGIKDLTFEDLLRHRSGLGQKYQSLSDADKKKWTKDWDGLKFIVQKGTSSDRSADYENANFGLFRVIIPALWKASGDHPGIGPIVESSAGFWYVSYMQNHVFKPLGIESVTCRPQSAYPNTLAYVSPSSKESGASTALALKDCGGQGGLHLSSSELRRIEWTLATTEELLPASWRNLMDQKGLGWDSYSNGIYQKNGALTFSGGRRVETCVSKFPGPVVATLVVNSNFADEPCRVLRSVFQSL
jgi:CubicO group peptidase (beta-lactamase class C family)